MQGDAHTNGQCDAHIECRVHEASPPLLVEQHGEREPRAEHDFEREGDARAALRREPRDE